MTALTPVMVDAAANFFPWESEAKKALRLRLLKAQRVASNRARVCPNSAARGLLWDVTAVAAEWAFKPASNDDLRMIGDTLFRLFTVADTFARMEVGDAS